MFCRACESLAAVYNIENGQPSSSAMKRHHSGGNPYGIMVSPVQGNVCSITSTSRVCGNKIWLITAIDKSVLYFTPDKLESGSACHMTRSANHRCNSIQLLFKLRGRIQDLGQNSRCIC